MSIVQPTDGWNIFELIDPSTGQSTWGPRLDQMRAAGFKLVMNYTLMIGSTANMIAYINYAASIGMRVIVPLWDIWLTTDLSALNPTMYVESGSHGITNANAFALYAINQVKNLPGTWGYYIADEPGDYQHSVIKTFYTYCQTVDSTHPYWLSSSGDLGTGSTAWGQDSVFYDCCNVLGDSHYIVGLSNRADDPQTVATNTQAYCTLKGVDSTTVLQVTTDTPGTTMPTAADMVQFVQQTLARMTPRMISWYAYYDIWGTPTGPWGAAAGVPNYGPTSAIGNAATVWNNLTIALNAPGHYARVVLVDSPVRYYRLSDSVACTYYDDLVSANQLTTTAPSRTTGLLIGDNDGAMSFNGTTSKFSMATTGLPTGNHAYTLECWVSLPSLPSPGHYPIALGLGSDVADEELSLYFSGDTQRFTFSMKGNEVASLAAPLANTTYHLVGVYTGGVVSFYVNGVLQGTMNRTLNMVYGTATIGVDPSGGLFWSGIVDEVAIYTTALSAARILAHYNAGLAISPSVRTLGNGRTARIG